MGWNDFSLPACGEVHSNGDGTCRQCELALCRPGDPLRLVREPRNIHDRNAIAIVTKRGVRVGYLSRQYAAVWASKLDRGAVPKVIVERIKGATLAGAMLGLVMRVNLEGEEPELPCDPNQVVRWVA
jgi:hypothetical protein